MNLKQKLENKEFVITAEINPPAGSGVKKTLEKVLALAPWLDAINISCCPTAKLRMDPLAFAILVNKETAVETILHITMRDQNLLGLQSYLFGAAALGYHYFLSMTGDAAKMSNIKNTKGVFQGNSLHLLKIMQELNTGYDSQGGKLNRKTNFFPAAVANPGAINLPAEIERMHKKVQAGARFFQTQPIFNHRDVTNFLQKSSAINVPILIAMLPLSSYQNCLKLNRDIPGLFVPGNVMERLKNSPCPEQEGGHICYELWTKIHKYLPGIHFLPHLNFAASLELIKEIHRQKKQ